MATRRSFRMPLAVLALLCAAVSLVLSAVLLAARADNGQGGLYMLEFDTSQLHDALVTFVEDRMGDVGLPRENLGVDFTQQTIRRLYLNDTSVNGTTLVDDYLTSTPPPPNLAPWEPELGSAHYISLFVQGLNATDAAPVQVSTDMTVAAGELAFSLSEEGDAWAASDRNTFDVGMAVRLRYAGTVLTGVGSLGLLVVAAARGHLPGLALHGVALLLAGAALCELVSAGLLTHSLQAIAGSYAPFAPRVLAPVVYRASSAFLGVTWASAALALLATGLAAAVAFAPPPAAAHRPRWLGRRRAAPLLSLPQDPAMHYSRPQTAAHYDGHKSISPPYNHSATVDEAAEARGVAVQYPPYALAVDDRRGVYNYNYKRYSDVSSLGPSPTRARF